MMAPVSPDKKRKRRSIDISGNPSNGNVDQAQTVQVKRVNPLQITSQKCYIPVKFIKPVNVLDEVMAQLSSKDLKSARLVCKLWAQKGFDHLKKLTNYKPRAIKLDPDPPPPRKRSNPQDILPSLPSQTPPLPEVNSKEPWTSSRDRITISSVSIFNKAISSAEFFNGCPTHIELDFNNDGSRNLKVEFDDLIRVLSLFSANLRSLTILNLLPNLKKSREQVWPSLAFPRLTQLKIDLCSNTIEVQQKLNSVGFFNMLVQDSPFLVELSLKYRYHLELYEEILIKIAPRLICLTIDAGQVDPLQNKTIADVLYQMSIISPNPSCNLRLRSFKYSGNFQLMDVDQQRVEDSYFLDFLQAQSLTLQHLTFSTDIPNALYALNKKAGVRLNRLRELRLEKNIIKDCIEASSAVDLSQVAPNLESVYLEARNWRELLEDLSHENVRFLEVLHFPEYRLLDFNSRFPNIQYLRMWIKNPLHIFNDARLPWKDTLEHVEIITECTGLEDFNFGFLVPFKRLKYITFERDLKSESAKDLRTISPRFLTSLRKIESLTRFRIKYFKIDPTSLAEIQRACSEKFDYIKI